MKHVIAIFSALLFSIILGAQEHLTYMNVPLDGNLSQVVSALEMKGLVVCDKPSENIVQMRYEYNGQPIDVLIVANPETEMVYRAAVLTQPKAKWRSLKNEYSMYKKLLMEEYGEPRTYEMFFYPYDTKRKLRRHQMQALHEEKVVCSSFFYKEGDSPVGKVGVITLTIIPYAHLGRVAIYYNDFQNSPDEE